MDKLFWSYIILFSLLVTLWGKGWLAILCFAALSSPSLANDRRVPVNNLQIQLSFAPIVEQTAPAVVNIYAKNW